MSALKGKRLESVNELINVIASHGRKFFWCPKSKRFGYFMIDMRGCLYWRDEWTGKFVFMSRDGLPKQDDIHHGSTLREVLRFLSKYIRTGKSGDSIPTLYLSNWGYDEKSEDIVKQKIEEVFHNG